MDCVTWLRSFLAKSGYEAEYSFVKEEAKKAGFTRGELKEARKKLGVRTWHQVDDGAIQNWFWYLEE